jgi:manganese/zinc/iron transport system substrate-binding protein
MRFTPVFLVAAFVFGACSTPQNEVDTGTSSKPKVLCTTSIMADWLKNISGDAFEVTALLDKGIDPHTYKPSKRDLDAIRAADVIIYHGVHLEGKIIDVLEKIDGKLIIDAAANVPDSIIISDPNFPASKDPHYWFDTELVQFIVGDIAQQLSAAYPSSASQVQSATVNYQQEILTTSDSVQKIIARIAPEQRLVITTHDALSYFARTFGMRVQTLQGASTVSEFGLREITELVDFICANKVPAIFLENIVSPQAMESVQRGCQDKGFDVVLGPELLSDSLGPDADQDTYLEMLLFNATLLKTYLAR